MKIKSFQLIVALATTLLCAWTHVLFAQTLTSYPSTVWIEAESFAEKGGWGLDTQAVGAMGSPYLIAHGWGNPVADASTSVEIPSAGVYTVYARTRNWVAPWTPQYAPGKFTIQIGDAALEQEFGTNGEAWSWQSGGDVTLAKGKTEIKLHDLTGFDGRVDAIILTKKEDKFTPPNELSAIQSLRRQALNLPADPPTAANGKIYDLVVVGGGIAGCCAAVSAARLGASVAFIQDRPVLGGNGSTEVRVHLNGEINMAPYPNLGNLTHLMGPHGGGNAREADHYKDQNRFDLVTAEKNIDLYLCTRVSGAQVVVKEKGVGHIASVIGTNVETGQQLRFLGKTFADCTGDAALGYLAGADWSMGREAKKDYDEPSAPEEGDKMTMGSSIQWNTAETAEPCDFPELPWAIQFNEKTIKPSTHGDWDWEGGMNRDQIADIERIRDVGLRAAYGHWSYMKNHTTGEWAEKVKNRKLNWVAFVAGKRESRRLLGDVVLREQDIVGAQPYEDASVTTTWSIDLHYPEPSNAENFPGEEFRAICRQVQIKPYAIPYRCFYSRNVDNLFMAGRDISVTHIALGTIRVMRTGGMMGEVVGMAASICKNHDCLPRAVYTDYLDELKALMTEGVAPPTPKASVANYAKPNATNLAPKATLEVSSNYKKGPSYPKEFINDGKFDVSDNRGRWVSDVDDGHWVDFKFDEPTTINAAIIVTGQAPGQTPISDFLLQYEDADGRLTDIPGSAIEQNESPIVALQFKETTSKRFRLRITQTPGGLARLWEVEFYRVKK